MAGQKRFTLKKRYLPIFVGLAVFFVYLYFFVPFGQLVETVHRLNPFYFLLAFFALLASVVFYSLAWRRLLGLLSVRASFLKVFQFVWVENFVDLVIPGEPVSGEVSRIYLMSKETGEDYGKVVASAVAQRIATTSVVVTGLLASIVFFALTVRPPLFVLAFAGLILFGDVVVIFLLFYFAMRRGSTVRLVNWLFNLVTRISRGHWRFERVRERIAKALDIFHDGIVKLGEHRKNLVLPMVFTAFSWFSDMSIAVLVFLALTSAGTEISMSAIIIVYSISGSIQYLPIGVIPGEVGLTEIVMTTLFALLGNPQFLVVYAAATVLIRGLTFWVRALIGGIVVQATAVKSLMPSQTLS
ncbi:MAG TPA: flippase-like domain-containing protein [candidate division Zixibacteria bacterium]|nr:flippase-like domain-containing protein [candidate division Zixibacteria bacterium]